MKKLALRDTFSNAKNTLENHCYYYINILSTPKSMQIPKAENTGPIRSDFIDLANTAIHRVHDSLFDSFIQKALAGDYAPKPGAKDIITSGIKAATPMIPRLTPYLKSPAYAIGLATIFGATLLFNQTVRKDIAAGLDKVSNTISSTSDDTARKLSEALPYQSNFPTPNFQLIKRG